MKRIIIYLVFLSFNLLSPTMARGSKAKRIDFCKRIQIKSEQKFILSQTWFYIGKSTTDNFIFHPTEVVYHLPVKYIFKFPKKLEGQLWIGCSYIRCLDKQCLKLNPAGSEVDMEYILISKIPSQCLEVISKDNPLVIESLVCN